MLIQMDQMLAPSLYHSVNVADAVSSEGVASIARFELHSVWIRHEVRTWLFTLGRVRTFILHCFALRCHSASVSCLPTDICFCYSVDKANKCPLIHFYCSFYSHFYQQSPSACCGSCGNHNCAFSEA